jgi:predicted esterase
MWGIGHPSATRWKFYGKLHGKMKRQFTENPPKGYYLYAGTKDMMRPATHSLHKYMEKNGFPHTYAKYPASHSWANGWIEELKDVMQRIFKEE